MRPSLPTDARSLRPAPVHAYFVVTPPPVPRRLAAVEIELTDDDLLPDDAPSDGSEEWQLVDAAELLAS